MLSKNLETTLHRALALAKLHRHEYATLEHLLFALMDDADASVVMRGCGVNLAELKRTLGDFIEQDLASLTIESVDEAKPTAGFQRVIHRAAIHVQSAGKSEVSGANVLVALFSERESHAVYFLQEHAKASFGRPVPVVNARVTRMQGTFSGGTAASGRATFAAAMKDPSILTLLQSPFALTPGFAGAAQPNGSKPKFDEAIGAWVAPFFMAVINTKNVHRSNFLMGHPYGADFGYDEMIVTGPGEAGEKAAAAVAASNPMADENGPKPGEGPTREEREAGHYTVLFVGTAPDGRSVRTTVTGDMDPGYGSTSKMISQCALCLVDEAKGLAGGIYTTAPAFGMPLIERLAKHAGLTFTIE